MMGQETCNVEEGGKRSEFELMVGELSEHVVHGEVFLRRLSTVQLKSL